MSVSEFDNLGGTFSGQTTLRISYIFGKNEDFSDLVGLESAFKQDGQIHHQKSFKKIF